MTRYEIDSSMASLFDDKVAWFKQQFGEYDDITTVRFTETHTIVFIDVGRRFRIPLKLANTGIDISSPVFANQFLERVRRKYR